MLGAGTIINPIIKIVTTVAILAAVYFFIVKPTLDTTNDVINRSFDVFDESFEGLEGLPASIQNQIENAGSSQALQDCIRKALEKTPPDQQRIERCIERFGA